MNVIAWRCRPLFSKPVYQVLKIYSATAGSNVSFSTTSNLESARKFRNRWITQDKWVKNKYNDEPWAPNVPMEHAVEPWRQENAYFGTYDFMDILGNDLTMQPELLCKGPSYMRGQKLNELQMLIKRRKMYGTRMHSEDLNQARKRIKYLLKQFNQVVKKQY